MPRKRSKNNKREGNKSKKSKSSKQRPTSLQTKHVTPIEYTGPRIYSAPLKYITNSEKFVRNQTLPYVRPEPPREELLTDFLSKCTHGSSGSYVNQGSYGIGLKYQITQTGITSPFEYITLSHLASNIMPDNSTIFVKFVPLTEPPPAKEFIHELNTINAINCNYVDYEGDIALGELETPLSNWTENDDLNIDGYSVDYEKFRGFNWKIYCNQKPVSSTYIGQFLYECTSQVDIFKRTNHNLDSFILPVYESLVITQDNLHIIEQLKDCYHFGGPNSVIESKFFDSIIIYLKKSKYFKMGIIVMPMMPFPPVVVGWNYLSQKDCYQNDYKRFSIENIADKYANDYYIYKHTDTDEHKLTENGRYSLLFLSQLISHMITLLENGFIHGDVHPGNTLMHTELSNTSDGNRSPNYRGKSFLIDFGTVVKDVYWIPWNDENDDYKRFKLQIKMLIVSRGAHGFSPLESTLYDWLLALFLKREKGNNNDYQIKKDYTMGYLVNNDTIIDFDDKEGISPYFIEENFITMYDWVNEYRRGNREFIENSSSVIESHKELFNRLRAFNKSGNTRSAMRGGGDSDVHKMIANLEYGQQSVNALRGEYSYVVNIKSLKKPKSIIKVNMKPKRNKTMKIQSKIRKNTIRQYINDKSEKKWKH